MAGKPSVTGVAEAMAGQYRELTVAAVVLGVIQGVVLNLAFVYAALKLGFSIGGSTVAAITGSPWRSGVASSRRRGSSTAAWPCHRPAATAT